MIFLKFASVLFIVLPLIVSISMVKLFKLHKKGWNFADIAFPIFAFEFYLVSDKVYYHSFLPHLILALSILALGITCSLLFGRRTFSYRRFLKFFWRAGFILTFLMYLALVIALFTMKS
ncbi:DUF3397 domain-containing protein [Streptococcus marmotae]|uniref:DUF3397 domain-containing protein n=1 Tax=Streptococcus marmotae TaxID=1825069 RepID=UPI00082AC21F|nr:DUF3397 domain-containing protein [Streptococcus marmotae]